MHLLQLFIVLPIATRVPAWLWCWIRRGLGRSRTARTTARTSRRSRRAHNTIELHLAVATIFAAVNTTFAATTFAAVTNIP